MPEHNRESHPHKLSQRRRSVDQFRSAVGKLLSSKRPTLQSRDNLTLNTAKIIASNEQVPYIDQSMAELRKVHKLRTQV
jgi:hypothetical protein